MSGLFSTHLLSLDALLAVIDSIEQHCHHRILATATEASKNTQTAGKGIQHTANNRTVTIGYSNASYYIKARGSLKIREYISMQKFYGNKKYFK